MLAWRAGASLRRARRSAAHELALIEVVAHIDRDHMAEGIKAIRAGILVGITEEERVIRCQAIDLLEEARQRYSPPAVAFENLSAAADLAARLPQIDEDGADSGSGDAESTSFTPP